MRKIPLEKPKEKAINNEDERSESEPSWSSIDEENEEISIPNNSVIEVKDEKNTSGTDNEIVCEIESPKVMKKYRKRRKEKSRADNLKIIRDENNITSHHEGTLQLRPLLTPSS